MGHYITAKLPFYRGGRAPIGQVPFPVAGSDEIPSSWKYKGFQYFASPHPIYPWPKEVVRRIQREVDPLFVPLWVRQVWESPAGSVHVFDRHVIAGGIEHPNSPPHRDLRTLLLPTGKVKVWPHEVHDILAGDLNEGQQKFGVPVGDYLPLDWGVLYTMQKVVYDLQQLSADPDKRAVQQAGDPREAEAARDKALYDLVSPRWDEELPIMRRNPLSDVSSTELNEHFAPKEFEPKPTVVLGAS